MKRFDTPFGDNGGDQPFSRLLPFCAEYRFQGRTFSIRTWCRNWTDARTYCRHHGLTLTGKLIQDVKNDDQY